MAMNKFQKALNAISDTLTYYMVRKDLASLPSENEIYGAMALLRKLVNKADSFEWIPISERIPEEHDSVFAKLYGTDKWNDAFWRTKSKEVLVTIEYEDGTRTVKSSHTTDGKWWIEKKTTLSKFKVIAWMPMPELYKEKDEKPTYKLSQFEYNLLQHFSVDFKFKEMGLLKEMKEKGHFKNINGDELIKDILESCEVIK